MAVKMLNVSTLLVISTVNVILDLSETIGIPSIALVSER